MSSVNPLFGSGLGGDAYPVFDGNGRQVYTNGRPQYVHRGEPGFAERHSAALSARLDRVSASAPIKERDLPGRAPVSRVEYFHRDGTYWVTDGRTVEQAGPVEVEMIEREGQRQDNGRIRFGYHQGRDDAELVQLPKRRGVERSR
ncbi:hypothetical protein IU498_32060 [Nocardia beijingensis]|uniref:hypothetical protein n=1 Tax=Nocardia beijingensis TaxID=95162 RepID=UPI001895A3A7|nr:hypothetical protein [Nocardia beijingensis]MBF6079265.1 hypothetical protein [Nocardia beijingensis]